MIKYIKNHINLGNDEGRSIAIKFARSMNSYEKRSDLKDSVINDLFKILRNSNSLSEYDGDLIEDTITALIREYNSLEFRKGSGIEYFSSDINSDLGYIYSFYPDDL